MDEIEDALSSLSENQKDGLRLFLTQEKPPALPLNDIEKEMIAQYDEKRRSLKSPVSFKKKTREDSKEILLPHSARGTHSETIDLLSASLCNATGTKDPQFGLRILADCLSAVPNNYNPEDDKWNAVLNALNALQPADEYEGMLISRLVALHFQSMNFLSRTISSDQTTLGIDLNINRSTKLMRLYNETLETLMRYRRKGEQKVTVQYVQVNDGGQAVVGGVFTGGGGQQKNSDVSP